MFLTSIPVISCQPESISGGAKSANNLFVNIGPSLAIILFLVFRASVTPDVCHSLYNTQYCSKGRNSQCCLKIPGQEIKWLHKTSMCVIKKIIPSIFVPLTHTNICTVILLLKLVFIDQFHCCLNFQIFWKHNNRLVKYNDILCDSQYGLRGYRSTCWFGQEFM